MSTRNDGVAMAEETDDEKVTGAITAEFARRADGRRADDRVRTPRSESVHIFRVPTSLEEPHKRKFVPDTLFLGLFSQLDSNYFSESATQFKIEVVDECIGIMNSPLTPGDDRWDWEKLKTRVVGDSETDTIRAKAGKYYDLDKSYCKSADVERHVLALDSIFLSCYLCAYFLPAQYYASDPDISGIVSRRSQSFHQRLMTDIVKLQNQIPFFLISGVVKVISTKLKSDPNLLLTKIYNSWISYHSVSLPGITTKNFPQGLQTELSDRHHLLECLCHVMDRTGHRSPGKGAGPSSQRNGSPKLCCGKSASRRESHMTGKIRTLITGSNRPDGMLRQGPDDHKEISLPSASELRKGGVHFRGGRVLNLSQGVNLVPKFSRGFMNISATIQIPAFSVFSNTEVLWTNMIAYIHEKGTLGLSNQAADFINFLMFMDEMVDTEKDVALLRFGKRRVILKNLLGSNQEVAELLNKLVQQQPADSIEYGEDWQSLRYEINAFYIERERIVFLEFLRNNFGKPWFVISIIVGSFVLVLSFLQTFYTMLTYYTG